ncbi:MAG TPA: alternative ribosome rescue aminoacyl-tRNA hydrolase ArfB [Nannocystaceae bacterium]|nr:alternative ribosome rescue aminoacyl-tRNA hydrolase ArfB [Nannocystaceae bacterium]
MAGELEIDVGAAAPVVIPAGEIAWTAVRASGPGGQNVNKVATKIDLRFDLAGSRALPETVKARLRALAATRLDPEGRLVVTSSLTRDQSRNLDDARAKLAALVRAAWPEPKRRRKTRPSAGARRRRLSAKRERSETKSGRARVKNDD